MHGMHGMRGACMPCMGARRLQHAGNKQHRLAQLVTAGCAAPSLRGRRAVLSLSQRQPPPSVGGGAAAAARVAACQLLRPHFINRVFATVCSPASRFLANSEARIFPSPLPHQPLLFSCTLLLPVCATRAFRPSSMLTVSLHASLPSHE